MGELGKCNGVLMMLVLALDGIVEFVDRLCGGLRLWYYLLDGVYGLRRTHVLVDL